MYICIRVEAIYIINYGRSYAAKNAANLGASDIRISRDADIGNPKTGARARPASGECKSADEERKICVAPREIQNIRE